MTEQLIVVRRPIFPDLLEELRRHARVVDNQSGTALEGASLAGTQPPDLLNKEE